MKNRTWHIMIVAHKKERKEWKTKKGESVVKKTEKKVKAVFLWKTADMSSHNVTYGIISCHICKHN